MAPSAPPLSLPIGYIVSCGRVENPRDLGNEEVTIIRSSTANKKASVQVFGGLSDKALGNVLALATSNDSAATRLRDSLEEYGLEDLAELSNFVRSASKSAVARSLERKLRGEGPWSHNIKPSGKPELQGEGGADAGIGLKLSFDRDLGVLQLTLSSSDGGHGGDPQVERPTAYLEAFCREALQNLFADGLPGNAGLVDAFRVDFGDDLAAQMLNEAGKPLALELPDEIFCCAASAIGEAPPKARRLASPPVVLRFAERSADGSFVTKVSLEEYGGAEDRCCASYPEGAWAVQMEVLEARLPIRYLRRGVASRAGGRGGSLDRGSSMEIEVAPVGEFADNCWVTCEGLEHQIFENSASCIVQSKLKEKEGESREVPLGHDFVQLPPGSTVLLQLPSA